MEIDATPEDFYEWIGTVLRIKADPNEDGCRYVGPGKLLLQISTSRIETIIQSLSKRQEIDDTTLCDDHYYEVLVRPDPATRFSPFGRIGPRVDEDQRFELFDKENEITYTLSPPSDDYLLFLIYKIAKLGQMRDLHIRSPELLKTGVKTKNYQDPLEVIKILLPRILTLRIAAAQKQSHDAFVKYSNSFFFQWTFNLDSSLVPQRYLDEILRTARINRIRRNRPRELEAPKRIYIPDLIYHYQLAVASENPALEYLSFYHIAEYFFEAVFKDELTEQVRNILTQPDFSYRRKKDISKLINEVSKSVKYQRDTVVVSEQKALFLTLKRYISLKDLLDQIVAFDPTLPEYYRSNPVYFCDGPKFDLESDSPKDFENLSKRIYLTRNAIVHSKEGDKAKFIPFDHDRTLVKEVPLLRFIAESIVIKSSTLM